MQYYLDLGFAICFMAWFYFAIERKRRPIKSEDIIYQEWFRSGYRLTPFWARFGGANNCLKFLILKDRLVLRAHFPFSVIGYFFLDFEIPYENIISISRQSFLLHNRITLEFLGTRRKEKVVFTVRNPEKVMDLLLQFNPGILRY